MEAAVVVDGVVVVVDTDGVEAMEEVVVVSGSCVFCDRSAGADSVNHRVRWWSRRTLVSPA